MAIQTKGGAFLLDTYHSRLRDRNTRDELEHGHQGDGIQTDVERQASRLNFGNIAAFLPGRLPTMVKLAEINKHVMY